MPPYFKYPIDMNKFILYCILIGTVILLPRPSQAQERKRVAVVLSGGGAKGVAHIGALKVLEEAGIPIDYIVGTSMGAIVGGLYSVGYTAEQLDSLVRTQDWELLLSDRIERKRLTLNQREEADRYILSVPFSRDKQGTGGGLIQGENLGNLFANLTIGYHDSIDFNLLPTPFACVATDLVTGEEHVFHSGRLTTAMRASMAIPAVFTPVRQDSMVLVDGGLTNNYPADVARAMGADIIIGVSVQSELQKADGLNKVSDILSQVIDHACRTKLESNVAQTDLFIKVNTKGYSSASFTPNALDTLLRRGEEAARGQWNDIKAIKKSIGVAPDFRPEQHGPYSALSSRQGIYLKHISFDGAEEAEVKRIIRRCRLREETTCSMSQIESALLLLRQEYAYSDVSYQLNEGPGGGYDLHYHLKRRNDNRLDIGFRFDTEEQAALLLNASFRLNTAIPSVISLTGRLGQRYMARLNYRLEPSLMKHIDFSYTYRYDDLDLYNRGDKAYNVTYNRHTLETACSDVWVHNFRYTAGIQFEYFQRNDLLRRPDAPDWNPSRSGHFFNYFLRLQYNSFDRSGFPTRGADFSAAATVYTDNFAQYEGHKPFMSVQAAWTGAFSFNSRFTLLPSLYGRVLAGRNVAGIYGNVIGGDIFSRYLPQQLPFDGIATVEPMEKSIVTARLRLRQRIDKEHYVTLSGSAALTDDRLQDILDGHFLYGISLGYGFNSKFGPLEASIGYSNHTKEGKCFINLGYYF